MKRQERERIERENEEKRKIEEERARIASMKPDDVLNRLKSMQTQMKPVGVQPEVKPSAWNLKPDDVMARLNALRAQLK
jgi:hypothetical protein